MLVRHLREEAARQNWLGVAIDLIILILGVFLGIQVNNWNTARLDANKGVIYRERLVADLEANLKDLDNRRVYYIATRDHAQAALDALDQPVGENPSGFLLDAYQALMVRVLPASICSDRDQQATDATCLRRHVPTQQLIVQRLGERSVRVAVLADLELDYRF